MNISVPAELKEDMDCVEVVVNWSKVAAEAFRSKVLEIESQRKGTTMSDVINRMKAAAELEKNQDYNDGKAAGLTWAKEDATPKQLRRLEDEYSGPSLWLSSPNAFGWAGVVYSMIHGDFEDRNELNDFWESAIPDAKRIEDEAFAEGFVDGALELWESVKKHI